jgi:hypothetical protein
LLGAVGDFDARVAAEKPRPSDHRRGRQAEKRNCGNYAAQHGQSLTGPNLFRKHRTAFWVRLDPHCMLEFANMP